MRIGFTQALVVLFIKKSYPWFSELFLVLIKFLEIYRICAEFLGSRLRNNILGNVRIFCHFFVSRILENKQNSRKSAAFTIFVSSFLNMSRILKNFKQNSGFPDIHTCMYVFSTLKLFFGHNVHWPKRSDTSTTTICRPKCNWFCMV